MGIFNYVTYEENESKSWESVWLLGGETIKEKTISWAVAWAVRLDRAEHIWGKPVPWRRTEVQGPWDGNMHNEFNKHKNPSVYDLILEYGWDDEEEELRAVGR